MDVKPIKLFAIIIFLQRFLPTTIIFDENKKRLAIFTHPSLLANFINQFLYNICYNNTFYFNS